MQFRVVLATNHYENPSKLSSDSTSQPHKQLNGLSRNDAYEHFTGNTFRRLNCQEPIANQFISNLLQLFCRLRAAICSGLSHSLIRGTWLPEAVGETSEKAVLHCPKHLR